MILLAAATSDNWRDIARVRAADHQRRWVADVTYYLCLSAYEELWRSCAVLDDGGTTVGHVMWAVDPEDGSHWIGGLVIDAEHLGRATVEALLALWEDQEPSLSGTPYHQAALSVVLPSRTPRGYGPTKSPRMFEVWRSLASEETTHVERLRVHRIRRFVNRVRLRGITLGLLSVGASAACRQKGSASSKDDH
jgi:diamine N-acetyltransferase